MLRRRLRGSPKHDSPSLRRKLRQIVAERTEGRCAAINYRHAPHETVYEALGKLANVFQKSDEEVITFANRVRELGKRILDAFKREYDSISPTFVNSTDENLKRCFLRGLKSEIAVRIPSMHHNSLNALITKAIVIQKENDAIYQMRSGSYFLKRHKAQIDYENELLKSNGRSIPFQNKERIIVPARSRSRAYVIAMNPEIGEGYAPRLKFRGINGLYLGDALVRITNGKAHLDVITTNDRDVELVIPKIKIQELSSVSTTAPVGKPVQSKSKQSSSSDNRDDLSNSLNRLTKSF
ncbi:hypothetical protein WH47_11093 [Habropoda laboriosa]|uniref:Uncharacterized protein n=1 Tax=Habropoda laboriosa TaxID=597456 RepID=A0A0L7QLY2_9HYME|nr:hypothetical protein WH47_11093 [Habropoda laboriosa]